MIRRSSLAIRRIVIRDQLPKIQPINHIRYVQRQVPLGKPLSK
jgi:hypothetical protein